MVALRTGNRYIPALRNENPDILSKPPPTDRVTESPGKHAGAEIAENWSRIIDSYLQKCQPQRETKRNLLYRERQKDEALGSPWFSCKLHLMRAPPDSRLTDDSSPTCPMSRAVSRCMCAVSRVVKASGAFRPTLAGGIALEKGRQGTLLHRGKQADSCGGHDSARIFTHNAGAAV